MKFMLLMFGSLLLATSAYSQGTILPSSKMVSAYSKGEIAHLTDAEIDYLNFYAEQGFTVHPEGKVTSDMPLLSSVLLNADQPINGSTLTTQNFNPLLYSFQPSAESLFFKVDGTQKVVQVFAKDRTDKLYERFKINRAKLERNNKK